MASQRVGSSRNSTRTVILLALGMTLLWGESSLAAEAQRPRLSLLVEQILALFPSVKGEVIKVQENRVTLSAGRRQGLRRGMSLELFREGRELRHPETGELLGRTEQPLGQVSVAQVLEGYSTGTVLGGAAVRVGDKVRLSAGKIKLTVLSVAEDVNGSLVETTVHGLVEALNRTDRFHVIFGDRITLWLAERRIKGEAVPDAEILQEAMREFEVLQLLVLAFTRVQRQPHLGVRLFSAPGYEPLLSSAMFLPASIQPAPAGQSSSGSTTPPNRPRR